MEKIKSASYDSIQNVVNVIFLDDSVIKINCKEVEDNSNCVVPLRYEAITKMAKEDTINYAKIVLGGSMEEYIQNINSAYKTNFDIATRYYKSNHPELNDKQIEMMVKSALLY